MATGVAYRQSVNATIGPENDHEPHAVMDVTVSVLAAKAARGAVESILGGWGYDDPDLVDDVVLIVSELVTNAVRHAPDDEVPQLHLESRPHALRIGVSDGAAIRPLIRELSDTAESGRGMRIIAALASRWGVDDQGRGKRVWVEMDRPRP